MLGLLVAGELAPALAAEPEACASIERPRLVMTNLGQAGQGRLVLRGELPSAPDSFEAGELRVEDLGSSAAPVVAMSTSGGTAGDCRRLHAGRVRGVRQALVFGTDCSKGPSHERVLLRVGRGSSRAGKRFVLRAGGLEIEPPDGPLRATVVFGAGAESCSRWTFPPEDCVLDDAGTTLRCVSTAATQVSRDCGRTGCSGQVCSDEPVATTCEFRPEYACYRDATCEPQPNGDCGWTPTEELQTCLTETRGSPLPPPSPGLPREEWFSCESDADCFVYPGLDCCGCAFAGGPEVAINRNARDEVDAYRICPDVVCPAEYLCREGLGAVCRAGRCAIE